MNRNFDKVLIANRGEIALRIIRTVRRLGMQAVAVYHDLDASSPHVAAAAEAYRLIADVPSAAYLDAEQIIEVALSCGAGAIHPGYGFLAENGDFAESIAAAGMVFVGPSPRAIRLMGDKLAARAFVAERGFPLAPSVAVDADADQFLDEAVAIGFPLLIKAAAGGGGKGMQIVRDAESFTSSLRLAQSEAQRYFGDGRVYCEKYIERPRHVEVQIMADEHNNVLHLGERDCSVQRRFQKIIEEAPAPNLSRDIADRLCDTAVAIARAAKYSNAGTVEFILDEDGAFYFLEMNTRLQVEHPVTEMTTGLDLVELQLTVAKGETLPLRQEEINHAGHALELRLCAEDPDADFLPATGTICLLRNASGTGIRIDSGLREGGEVTAAFDPMLAKLIIHGPDRSVAIARALQALCEQVIAGVSTNTDFLSRVLSHPEFASGEVHTHFIEQHQTDLKSASLDSATRSAVLAIAALHETEFRRLIDDTPEPHAAMGAWRNA